MADQFGAENVYWALAVHEAAHVVVGALFGLVATQIRLEPGKWLAKSTFTTGFSAKEWRKDLLVTLAGEAAQRRADPSGGTLHDEQGKHRAAHDFEQARRAASRFNYQGDILEIRRISLTRMEEGNRVVEDLVADLWDVIEALSAKILAADGTLEGEAIRWILQQEFPVDRRNAVLASCEFVHRPPQGM